MDRGAKLVRDVAELSEGLSNGWERVRKRRSYRSKEQRKPKGEQRELAEERCSQELNAGRVNKLEQALQEREQELEEMGNKVKRLQRQLYEIQKRVAEDKEAVVQQAELSRNTTR